MKVLELCRKLSDNHIKKNIREDEKAETLLDSEQNAEIINHPNN